MRWASCQKRREKPGLQLICFPYAGAGASAYRQWADEFPEQIEVWVVHLPGRDQRISETPIRSLSCMVEATAAGLAPLLNAPFAFFGHSMGALLAFEIARLRRRAGLSLPAALAVSGHRAPHLPDPGPVIHDLPRQSFVAELIRLNGVSEGVDNQPELLEVLLPMLRADFAACENYRFVSEAPLPCPILAFGGAHDSEASVEQIAAWRKHTVGAFWLRIFPGNHFFLHTARRELLDYIAEHLGLAVAGSAMTLA